jgi:hypothetical protein
MIVAVSNNGAGFSGGGCMKIVIASVNGEGKSYVESSREFPDDSLEYLWDEPGLQDLHDLIGRADPGSVAPQYEPSPGSFKWMYYLRPPASEAASHLGMHVTRTIDFNFVVSGHQQCILDEDTVELEQGDVIIIKAANHRWHNASGAPSAMLYMLYAPSPG